MSEAANDGRRPHPQPMAAPYLEFNLASELEQLQREAGWQSGHNAKTLIKYDRLRVVLIALQAGASIPTHRTDGQISIHAVSGHIQVRSEGRHFDLRQGGLLALDQNLAHDVKAVEASAILLTIAWPATQDTTPT